MDRKLFLYKLGLFCARRKWTAFFACLAVTAFLLVFAMRIEINLGMLTLLDRNDPEVVRVDYANDNFGGMDYTFVAVTADSLYDAKRFSDRLAEDFSQSPMVLRVVHKIDTDTLMKYAFLFLDNDQIDDFATFTKENQTDLQNIFSDVHAVPFLTSFNGMLERQLIEEDEIGDEKDALSRLDSLDEFLATIGQYLEQGEKLGPAKLRNSLRDLFIVDNDSASSSLADEYMISKDNKTVLMLIMPSETGDDMVFTKKMMDYMESTIDRLGADFPGAHVDIAGNVAIMRDEYNAIRRDTQLSTVVTFILVLFIFFFFFRKISDLLLIGVCLATGIVWTYAITYFYCGFLGITTAFFSAILLGLGIDFAIHVIARYAEQLRQGDPFDVAIANAIAGAGPGIITGALTTAAAFYVLMICRFKGITQLGFVAGTGIISMMIIMFTLLPSMLAIRDSRKKSPEKAKQMKEIHALAGLSEYMVHHRKAALVIILLLTIITGFAATKIRFNYDFRSLEPRNGKAVKANHKLEEAFDRSIDYSLLFAKSVEESRQIAKELESKTSVGEIHDISEYLPLDQEKKAPRIQKLAPLLDPVQIQTSPDKSEAMDKQGVLNLATAIRETRRMVLAVKQLAIVGGNPDVEDKCTEVMKNADALAARIEKTPAPLAAGGSYFQHVLADELVTLLGNLKQAAKAEELTLEKLPQVVRDNFIGKDGAFLVYGYPKGYIWTQEMLTQIKHDIRSVTPESTSIGVVFLELIAKVKQDFKFAVWLSLAMVFVLVYIDFRRLPTAIMALVPLVLGALWMIGTMALMGLTFNIVNVAVVPLIIGIGIDNGVHIIHRYRSESSDKIRQAVQHTGRAIFLSSITTMAGFGSLGLASYIAIASLGWVLVIGIIYCFLTSVVVLPILLSLLEKHLGRI